MVKRDQEYLKIDNSSNETSSIVISGGNNIVPGHNPPSQVNKRQAKQIGKQSLPEIINLLISKHTGKK